MPVRAVTPTTRNLRPSATDATKVLKPPSSIHRRTRSRYSGCASGSARGRSPHSIRRAASLTSGGSMGASRCRAREQHIGTLDETGIKARRKNGSAACNIGGARIDGLLQDQEQATLEGDVLRVRLCRLLQNITKRDGAGGKDRSARELLGARDGEVIEGQRQRRRGIIKLEDGLECAVIVDVRLEGGD